MKVDPISFCFLIGKAEHMLQLSVSPLSRFNFTLSAVEPRMKIIVHFSLFWHRVSFFLLSLIKIITIRFKNEQKAKKANVSATYGGPLQCHKFIVRFKIPVKD